MRDWTALLRERMAAEGLMPSAHGEAITEIADHLTDLYRALSGQWNATRRQRGSVEAELARMGPLAVAVANRARRRAPATTKATVWGSGVLADAKHAMRSLKRDRGFSAIVIVTLAIGIGACTLGLQHHQRAAAGIPAVSGSGTPGRRLGNREDDRNRDVHRRQTGLRRLVARDREFLISSGSGNSGPSTSHRIESRNRCWASGPPPACSRRSPCRRRWAGCSPPEEDAPGHIVVVISDACVAHAHGRRPLGHRTVDSTERSAASSDRRDAARISSSRAATPASGCRSRSRNRTSSATPIPSWWPAASRRTSFESARADVEQVGRALAQRYDENRDEGSTITAMSEQGLGPLRSMLTPLMGAVALVLRHRLRECRQSSIRSGARSATRVHAPSVARRGPREAGAPALCREPGAGLWPAAPAVC